MWRRYGDARRRPRCVATAAGQAPSGAQGSRADRGHRPQDRLGAEPARRSTRSSGQDEEDYYDLGDQLGPARQLQPEGPDARPGHRGELGHLRRQEDGHLPPGSGRASGPTASRSPPRTSSTRSRCSAATARCSPATRTTSPRSTRRTSTRSSSTRSGPTPGSSGASSSTSFPSTSGARCPVNDAHRLVQPKLPLVGSGPYIVTDFQPNRIMTMERNPNFRGPAPELRQDPVHPVRQPGRRRAGASSSARWTSCPRCQAAGFAATRRAANIETVKASRRRTRSWRSTCCPAKICPDANFNPAIQDPAVRQAIAYAVDRERINAIAARGHLVPGTRDPAVVLQVVLRAAGRRTTHTTPTRRGRSSTTRAGQDNGDGPRTKGGRGALVQPLRPLGVAVQHPGGEARRRGGRAGRDPLQRPGGQHRQAL